MKKSLSLAIIVAVSTFVACPKKELDNAADTPAKITSTQPRTGLANQTVPTAHKEKTNTKHTTYTEIDWVDLIPDDDLLALENPPAYLNDIEDGSANDLLVSQLKNKSSPRKDRYQQALTSQQIRPEFNGRHVRIPGFIVPLEYNDQQTVTTFFLVPFFGACLHMPPPPPNQIIYVEYEPGIHLNAFYDPFWIEGILSTTLIKNDMATAAYSISVIAVEPYIEGATAPAPAP